MPTDLPHDFIPFSGAGYRIDGGLVAAPLAPEKPLWRLKQTPLNAPRQTRSPPPSNQPSSRPYASSARAPQSPDSDGSHDLTTIYSVYAPVELAHSNPHVVRFSGKGHALGYKWPADAIGSKGASPDPAIDRLMSERAVSQMFQRFAPEQHMTPKPIDIPVAIVHPQVRSGPSIRSSSVGKPSRPSSIGPGPASRPIRVPTLEHDRVLSSGAEPHLSHRARLMTVDRSLERRATRPTELALPAASRNAPLTPTATTTSLTPGSGALWSFFTPFDKLERLRQTNAASAHATRTSLPHTRLVDEPVAIVTHFPGSSANRRIKLIFPRGLSSTTGTRYDVDVALDTQVALGHLTSAEAATLRPLVIRDFQASVQRAKAASAPAPAKSPRQEDRSRSRVKDYGGQAAPQVRRHESPSGLDTPRATASFDSKGQGQGPTRLAGAASFQWSGFYAVEPVPHLGGRLVATLTETLVSDGKGNVSTAVGNHVPTNVRNFSQMTELVRRLENGTMSSDALKDFFRAPGNEQFCKLILSGRDPMGTLVKDFSSYARRTLRPSQYPTPFVNEHDGTYSAGFGTTQTLNGFDQVQAAVGAPKTGSALHTLMKEASTWVVSGHVRAPSATRSSDERVDAYLSDAAALRETERAFRVLYAYGFNGGPLQRHLYPEQRKHFS